MKFERQGCFWVKKSRVYDLYTGILSKDRRLYKSYTIVVTLYGLV